MEIIVLVSTPRETLNPGKNSSLITGTRDYRYEVQDCSVLSPSVKVPSEILSLILVSLIDFDEQLF